MFVHGRLTRGPGADPRHLTFAVLDLETTGLDPREGARVCEIAIVRMRGDGVVLDEYSTVVNPGVPITNDRFHGVTDVLAASAPTFAQIAGDVLAYLGNAIVVSHNLDYEDRFLTAEFGRLGLDVRGVPGLCTLIMARSQLDHHVYRLGEIASLITGEWPAAYHSALGDARALARTLATFLAEAPQRLSWAGPAPVPLPPYPRSGLIAPRAAGLRKGSEGWLANLVARLPLMAHPPAPRPREMAGYLALLRDALADGRILGEEAQRLAVLAARAGLTQTTARQVHERFLAELRSRAEADGVVTPAELRELQRAARELAATYLIHDLTAAAAADRARRNGPLKGWRILPIGDTAELAEVVDFATGHGATVAVNVTKTVRLVVAADDAGDPRIERALNAGIKVLNPADALRLLEQEVAASRNEAGPGTDAGGPREPAERPGDGHARLRRSGPPEWHVCWRPRELSPAEYRARFIDPYQKSRGPARRVAPARPAPEGPGARRPWSSSPGSAPPSPKPCGA